MLEVAKITVRYVVQRRFLCTTVMGAEGGTRVEHSTVGTSRVGLHMFCLFIRQFCCNPIRATSALLEWLHTCVGVAVPGVMPQAGETRVPSEVHRSRPVSRAVHKCTLEV